MQRAPRLSMPFSNRKRRAIEQRPSAAGRGACCDRAGVNLRLGALHRHARMHRRDAAFRRSAPLKEHQRTYDFEPECVAQTRVASSSGAQLCCFYYKTEEALTARGRSPGQQSKCRHASDLFARLGIGELDELLGPFIDDALDIAIPCQSPDIDNRDLFGLPVGGEHNDLAR